MGKLFQADPFVRGVRLGDIAGPTDDELFQFGELASVRAVANGLWFALS